MPRATTPPDTATPAAAAATTTKKTRAGAGAAKAKGKGKAKAPTRGTSAKGTSAKGTSAKGTSSKGTLSKAQATATSAGSKGASGSKRIRGHAATSASASPTEASTGGSGRTPFLEAQRAKLLAERDDYARSATSLQAEADQLAQDREPGDVQFDEESGEGDSMNVERERDLALSAQAMASIEEIDRALARIDQGTYGTCERCREPIPEERLEALPHASLCVRCKSGGLGRR